MRAFTRPGLAQRVLASLLFTVPACAANLWDEPMGNAAGGTPAESGDAAVVAITSPGKGSVCSGVLLAPTVVITARHCVSGVEGAVARDAFSDASDILVTTRPNVFSPDLRDYRAVAEIRGLPADEDGSGTTFRGGDLAILVLRNNVPPQEAVPLEPRLDAPVYSGEPYSAVGFGATTDRERDVGMRRRHDGLAVACLACPDSVVSPKEWVGSGGGCSGDSGSPALDLQNRVIGIMSRAAQDCEAPVYQDIATRARWIRATTLDAAREGGYPPPRWTRAGN